MREVNPAFFTNYVCDDHAGVGSVDAKSLTILGASAVSLLAYDATTAAQKFLIDKYDFVRHHDIISSVWNYDFSVNNGVTSTGAILAWSTRLETIFVGIPGTQNVGDIVKDPDVHFKASTDLGSRFHHGFYNTSMSYRGLVQDLSKKYRVVICGHSLGGSVAAVVAYLVLAAINQERPCPNAWERPWGVSAITFGAPPAMVPEEEETTADFMKTLGKNIHNIINASESIPFATDITVDKLISLCENTGLEYAPQYSPSAFTALASEVPFEALRFLRGSGGRLAHFGCIHVLEIRSDDSIHCRSVNSIRTIPSVPEITRESITSNHSMDHYYNCVSRLLNQNIETRAGLIPEPDGSTLMNSEAFIMHCLGLPSTSEDFEGRILEDKVAVTGIIRSTLARHLITCATFKMEAENESRMTALYFSHGSHPNEILINMEYHIDNASGPRALLEAADAIQRDLRIHDVFGRETRVPIHKMQHSSAADISLPPTFESVRRSMLIALVEQTSKAEEIRSNDSLSPLDRARGAIVLIEKASHIAELIDGFVAVACPHIFVSNLEKACTHLKGIWEPTTKDLNAESGLEKTKAQFECLSVDCQASGTFPIGDERVPIHCPSALKTKLSHILKILDRSCRKNRYTREGCSENPRQTLQSTGAFSSSFFSEALTEYSRVLCQRQENEDERIQLEVEQTGKVLNVMRLCHLVILTQLEADPDWFFDLGDVQARRVIGPASFAAALDSLVYSPNLAGVLSVTTSLVSGGIAVGAAGYMKKPKDKAELEYEDKLAISLEILGIPKRKSGTIRENAISERLRVSNSGDSGSTPTERLQRLVQDRMIVYRNNRVQPTSVWMSWLLLVAQIGQLRTTISQQLRVGVIGSTGAGKSQLLSTLTGASSDISSSGSSLARHVQVYELPNCRAVNFLDFPWCEDRDHRIRRIGHLLQTILDVVIFVFPQGAVHGEQKEQFLKEEIIPFLSRDEEKRPVRILLSPADSIPFNHHQPKEFTDMIKLNKQQAINQIIADEQLPPNFTVRSRQPVRSGRTSISESGIVMGTETLDDIVRPYSTFAQLSSEGGKALSDFKEPTESKIIDKRLFEHLYDLADDGEFLWDVESLRQWLGTILPGSVPDTTRVNSRGVFWLPQSP